MSYNKWRTGSSADTPPPPEPIRATRSSGAPILQPTYFYPPDMRAHRPNQLSFLKNENEFILKDQINKNKNSNNRQSKYNKYASESDADSSDSSSSSDEIPITRRKTRSMAANSDSENHGNTNSYETKTNNYNTNQSKDNSNSSTLSQPNGIKSRLRGTDTANTASFNDNNDSNQNNGRVTRKRPSNKQNELSSDDNEVSPPSSSGKSSSQPSSVNPNHPSSTNNLSHNSTSIHIRNKFITNSNRNQTSPSSNISQSVPSSLCELKSVSGVEVIEISDDESMGKKAKIGDDKNKIIYQDLTAEETEDINGDKSMLNNPPSLSFDFKQPILHSPPPSTSDTHTQQHKDTHSSEIKTNDSTQRNDDVDGDGIPVYEYIQRDVRYERHPPSEFDEDDQYAYLDEKFVVYIPRNKIPGYIPLRRSRRSLKATEFFDQQTEPKKKKHLSDSDSHDDSDDMKEEIEGSETETSSSLDPTSSLSLHRSTSRYPNTNSLSKGNSDMSDDNEPSLPNRILITNNVDVSSTPDYKRRFKLEQLFKSGSYSIPREELKEYRYCPRYQHSFIPDFSYNQDEVDEDGQYISGSLDDGSYLRGFVRPYILADVPFISLTLTPESTLLKLRKDVKATKLIKRKVNNTPYKAPSSPMENFDPPLRLHRRKSLREDPSYSLALVAQAAPFQHLASLSEKQRKRKDKIFRRYIRKKLLKDAKYGCYDDATLSTMTPTFPNSVKFPYEDYHPMMDAAKIRQHHQHPITLFYPPAGVANFPKPYHPLTDSYVRRKCKRELKKLKKFDRLLEHEQRMVWEDKVFSLDEILLHTKSILGHVDLSEIINENTLAFLSPTEKDFLATLLPSCDIPNLVDEDAELIEPNTDGKDNDDPIIIPKPFSSSNEALLKTFQSNLFSSQLKFYQKCLRTGSLDPSKKALREQITLERKEKNNDLPPSKRLDSRYTEKYWADHLVFNPVRLPKDTSWRPANYVQGHTERQSRQQHLTDIVVFKDRKSMETEKRNLSSHVYDKSKYVALNTPVEAVTLQSISAKELGATVATIVKLPPDNEKPLYNTTPSLAMLAFDSKGKRARYSDVSDSDSEAQRKPKKQASNKLTVDSSNNHNGHQSYSSYNNGASRGSNQSSSSISRHHNHSSAHHHSNAHSSSSKSYANSIPELHGLVTSSQPSSNKEPPISSRNKSIPSTQHHHQMNSAPNYSYAAYNPNTVPQYPANYYGANPYQMAQQYPQYAYSPYYPAPYGQTPYPYAHPQTAVMMPMNYEMPPSYAYLG